MELFDYLSENEYPGRGILLGHNGSAAVIAYFIMGRSENSRNRIFERTDDGIRTRAFDENKCTDPSLIIYSPVRRFGGAVIVTNGDQTDTVYDELAAGGSFESALRKREFEPDSPNFTPRISGMMDENGYKLSILKSEDGSGSRCMRAFYEYAFERNTAHLIHTYEHNGNPIPSFRGEPRRFELPDTDIDAFSEKLFASLNVDNRVSLYVSYLFDNGAEETRIINRQG